MYDGGRVSQRIWVSVNPVRFSVSGVCGDV